MDQIDDEKQLSWFVKTLLKLWPRLGMLYLSKNIGIRNPIFDKAQEIFGQSERIDIFPAAAPRGFVIVIDRQTALYFYQDGDHFVYDGFEMGEYEKGDVTIFDGKYS